VDDNDVFPDWNCSIRIWCRNPAEKGFAEFANCNRGQTNKMLIAANTAALAKQRADAMEIFVEPDASTQTNVDGAITLEIARLLEETIRILQYGVEAERVFQKEVAPAILNTDRIHEKWHKPWHPKRFLSFP
jgi:hypothetical protein